MSTEPAGAARKASVTLSVTLALNVTPTADWTVTAQDLAQAAQTGLKNGLQFLNEKAMLSGEVEEALSNRAEVSVEEATVTLGGAYTHVLICESTDSEGDTETSYVGCTSQEHADEQKARTRYEMVRANRWSGGRDREDERYRALVEAGERGDWKTVNAEWSSSEELGLSLHAERLESPEQTTATGRMPDQDIHEQDDGDLQISTEELIAAALFDDTEGFEGDEEDAANAGRALLLLIARNLTVADFARLKAGYGLNEAEGQA